MSRAEVKSADEKTPFEICNPQGSAAFLILCDHAANALPAGYGSLGLAPSEFERHIAYDIGAAGVARGLADHLGCQAVLARYSRLLIDLNRGEDDPTLIMKLSDGAIIEANRLVDPQHDAGEFERRLRDFYQPYHGAITGMIDKAQAAGENPVLISMHSFTPHWRGVARPWQVGILWDRDDRVATPLMAALAREGMSVGDNEPYQGALMGDSMFRHGTVRGLPHVLIEIRQDLLSDEAGIAEWVARLGMILSEIATRPGMRQTRFFGSQVDASLPISAPQDKGSA